MRPRKSPRRLKPRRRREVLRSLSPSWTMEAIWFSSNGSMIRRWPVWMSASERHGQQRSSAGPASFSKTRFARVASPRWPCPAQHPSKAAYPSLWMAKCSAQSASAETVPKKTKRSPRAVLPSQRRRFDEVDMKKALATLAVTFLALSLDAVGLHAQVVPAITPDAPAGRPAALINLATPEGVTLVKGQWRYSDTKIIEVDHRSPGPDLRASGPPNRTYDITPHAGAADFDDSQWQFIEPVGLETRRSTGRLCFNWYRIKITLPEKVAAFQVAGSAVVFELIVDDYAEVWVNGKLPTGLGQTGGPLIKGFNAPNRVVLTRDARPGQQSQLAVFGANGPLSNPPGNFIWIRSATLDFYKPGQAGNIQRAEVKVDRRDAGLDAIVPAEPVLE